MNFAEIRLHLIINWGDLFCEQIAFIVFLWLPALLSTIFFLLIDEGDESDEFLLFLT